MSRRGWLTICDNPYYKKYFIQKVWQRERGVMKCRKNVTFYSNAASLKRIICIHCETGEFLFVWLNSCEFDRVFHPSGGVTNQFSITNDVYWAHFLFCCCWRLSSETIFYRLNLKINQAARIKNLSTSAVEAFKSGVLILFRGKQKRKIKPINFYLFVPNKKLRRVERDG